MIRSSNPGLRRPYLHRNAFVGSCNSSEIVATAKSLGVNQTHVFFSYGTKNSRGMCMLVGMEPVHATSSGWRTSISSTSNLYFRLITSSYVARRLSAIQVLLNGFTEQGSSSPRHVSGPTMRTPVSEMSIEPTMMLMFSCGGTTRKICALLRCKLSYQFTTTLFN